MEKAVFVAFCCIAMVYGYGESETYVSREHQGDYKYGIDHHFHGHWKGSSHPHGFGGLGDGHGNYKVGAAKFINFLPQSLVGGHGGNAAAGSSSESKGHHGHGISSQNFNLKSYSKW